MFRGCGTSGRLDNDMGSCCYNYLKDGGKSGGGWRLDSSALLLRWREEWWRMETG